MSELGNAQKFLTIEQATERIRRLGPAFANTTARQVRRWADTAKLPFVVGFGGRRIISEQELIATFVKPQLAAARSSR